MGPVPSTLHNIMVFMMCIIGMWIGKVGMCILHNGGQVHPQKTVSRLKRGREGNMKPLCT
jgi:hypothetical protein